MKKNLISIMLLIFVLSMAVNVYAATGNVSFNASETSVVQGKTFTIILKGSSDTNVIGIKAEMSYETSKLELVKKEVGNNFTDASANNTEIAIATGGVGAKDATLATYTFKVLDTAEVGDTIIKVSNIVLAADTNIEIPENKEVTIKIVAKEEPKEEEPKEEQPKEEQPKEEQPKEEQPKEETPKKDTTVKGDNKLAQTGAEVVSIIAIVALGVVGIVSYISYRKYNNI